MACFVSSDRVVAIVGWFWVIRGFIEEMIVTITSEGPCVSGYDYAARE
jgi:hypothetical protein